MRPLFALTLASTALAAAAGLTLLSCSRSHSGFANVFRSESEPNDSPLTASVLPLDGAGSGDVATAGDVDFWSFAAQSGQLIEVEILGVRLDQDGWASNDNCPNLQLLGTDGTTRLLAREYSASGWPGSKGDLDIVCFQIPAAGTYYLRLAQDAPARAGGAYGLRVGRPPFQVTQTEQEAAETSGVNDTPITAETLQPGHLRGFYVDGESDYYTFTVAADTIVYFEMIAYRNGIFGTDTDLYDPILALLDSDGTTLLTSNDDSYWYDSAISYLFTAAGTYYLRVGEWSGSEGAAAYYLAFTSSPAGTLAENDDNDSAVNAQTIAYDNILHASKAAANHDWFAFQGTAGDAVQVWVWDYGQREGAPWNVVPELVAVDGATPLPRSSPGQLGVMRFMLFETGIHYLHIANAVETAYSFQLRLQGRSTLESGSNDTIATANSLASGRVAGMIDPAGDVDVFSFAATANEVVRFQVMSGAWMGFSEVDRYGSQLHALVTVRDSTGAALAVAQTDHPAQGQIDAYGVVGGLYHPELCFSPPATGTYYLEIASEDGQGGTAQRYWILRR